MNRPEIPDELKHFIFECIDSVEQIDVLLLLREKPEQWFDANSVSRELRSNESSVQNRLQTLKSCGLLEENAQSQFRFAPRSTHLQAMVDSLAEAYRVRKHRVLELIFSSMKKARQFADAFNLKSAKPTGESDG